MSVEQGRWSGKHLPDSHPVIRRLTGDARLSPLPGSVVVAHEATDRLEAIAIGVQQLPHGPLSVLQQRMVDTIVAELLRRRHA